MNPTRDRWRRLTPWMLSLLLLPLAACDDDAAAPSPRATIDTSARGAVTIPLGDRPFDLFVPDSYDAAQPVPLVVLLHGYTATAGIQDVYFGVTGQAKERGFLVALPNGMVDSGGKQFWNATDYCCDLGHTGVDDSTYLSDLISLIKGSYAVSAVFLFGHSNGGFMSHRMACEHADQITAIAALAGVPWQDPARCTPSRPVSVLQIHGTSDATILYDGNGSYPGAEEAVARWRGLDGCSEVADTTAPALDLDTAVEGAETTVTTYAGCRDGTRVTLWHMAGSSHVPSLTDAFTPAVLDFLFATAGLP